jgi:hypothetical protein
MSPIFVRPVREQLEHDRLIRFLQPRYKKKLEVLANIGDEQAAPLKIGQNTFFPDLVLMDAKKLAGVVEIETGESVNNLEAMAQWVHFSKVRAPFHLYVPVTSFDAARRLCEAHHVRVAEIWTYRGLTEGFDLVRSFNDPSAASSRGSSSGAKSGKAASKAPAAAAKKPVKPVKPVKPAKRPPAKAPKKPAPKAKPKKPAKKARSKR